MKNWFTNRVVNEWNRLGEHVVSADTTDSLRRRLEKFMDDTDRWYVFFIGAASCRSTGLLQTPSFLMFSCSKLILVHMNRVFHSSYPALHRAAVCTPREMHVNRREPTTFTSLSDATHGALTVHIQH